MWLLNYKKQTQTALIAGAMQYTFSNSIHKMFISKIFFSIGVRVVLNMLVDSFYIRN
jgi:hypothetical protein